MTLNNSQFDWSKSFGGRIKGA